MRAPCWPSTALLILDGEKGTELGMKKIRTGAVGAGLVVVSICPCWKWYWRDDKEAGSIGHM